MRPFCPISFAMRLVHDIPILGSLKKQARRRKPRKALRHMHETRQVSLHPVNSKSDFLVAILIKKRWAVGAGTVA